MRLSLRLCLAGLLLLGCHDDQATDPDLLSEPGPDQAGQQDPKDGGSADARTVPDRPDLTRVVPWKAVNLSGPTYRVWEEYDYRPRAQGGFKEDIDARLEQLRSIGVRQVQIQTWYAWSVERTAYAGTSTISTVYYNAAYRPEDPSTWGRVTRTRRGDMGLVPYRPPTSWDQPTPLRTPIEIGKKAEAALGQMLEAVAAHGMIPVLKGEVYLVQAEDANLESGAFNNTDPSRNFDQFYKMYKEHLLDMTRVAARHGAAMFILGTETPYVTGGGQSRFMDGSRMTDRLPLITAKWKDIIQAVRQVAQAEGRPDLVLSYTEINPFYEARAMTEPRQPPWRKTPFWDDLDVVGINFYLPGRWSDGNGNYDTGAKTVDDMVRYGETHNFASDVIGNMQDIMDFFVGEKGYSLTTKPVIFPEDGCTATRTGAANPAAPPFLTLRSRPVFDEQQKLIEAHFRLFEKYGRGWLGGLGFWQVTPTLRWGGAYNAANTTNYSEAAAYFSVVDNPTEAVLRTYFARY